jgi:hypothetical protein
MKTITLPRELLIELLTAAQVHHAVGIPLCPCCESVRRVAKILAETAPKGKKK